MAHSASHPGQPGQPAPNFESMLAEAGRVLDGLIAANHQVVQLLNQLPPTVARIQQDLATVTAKVAELDRAFTQVLAERHQAMNPDTPQTKDLAHYDIADDLKQLLSDLSLTVVRALPTGSGLPSEERAQRCATIARALLSDTANPSQEIADLYGGNRALLFNDVIARAEDLRRRATELAPDHRFNFECHENAGVSPEYQTTWKNCDPHGVVMFAVAPAYVVGDRIYARQQVFTRSRPNDEY